MGHWKGTVLRIISLAIVLGLALAASALKLDLRSYKVVQVRENGKTEERLVPAAEVAPGDVLEWVLRAENTSDRALKKVALTIPIPPETVYLEGSAQPLRLKRGDTELRVDPVFSYDGVHFSPPPLTKKVHVREGGKVVEKVVVVPPTAYTHVRWLVPELFPRERVEVRLRTQVR